MNYTKNCFNITAIARPFTIFSPKGNRHLRPQRRGAYCLALIPSEATPPGTALRPFSGFLSTFAPVLGCTFILSSIPTNSAQVGLLFASRIVSSDLNLYEYNPIASGYTSLITIFARASPTCER
ncbi:uncharacterized protein TrAtP1_012613 [Trichoderma atroviride]|uniref:uncharacterized protein n=1 Tax=Hypocrea atroviridis TaxID=63577 RepID=UPI00331A84C2|nr:hypothetical protein TrAtP1_012613 [Trichoderma atroviride]